MRRLPSRSSPLSFRPPAALAVPAEAAWLWPVRGEVITPYRNGSDPYAGGQHRGIDIAAAVGTPVVAAAGGEVRFAGTAGSSGLTVSVRTADGYDTSYLHLSSIAVRAGAQRVRPASAWGRLERPASARQQHRTSTSAYARPAAGTRYLDPLSLLPPATAPPPAQTPLPAPAPAPAPLAPGPVPSPRAAPAPGPAPRPAPAPGQAPRAAPSPARTPRAVPAPGRATTARARAAPHAAAGARPTVPARPGARRRSSPGSRATPRSRPGAHAARRTPPGARSERRGARRVWPPATRARRPRPPVRLQHAYEAPPSSRPQLPHHPTRLWRPRPPARTSAGRSPALACSWPRASSGSAAAAAVTAAGARAAAPRAAGARAAGACSWPARSARCRAGAEHAPRAAERPPRPDGASATRGGHRDPRGPPRPEASGAAVPFQRLVTKRPI